MSRIIRKRWTKAALLSLIPLYLDCCLVCSPHFLHTVNLVEYLSNFTAIIFASIETTSYWFAHGLELLENGTKSNNNIIFSTSCDCKRESCRPHLPIAGFEIFSGRLRRWIQGNGSKLNSY
mmetsp:Transcript_11364/g.23962  ORF Transcript_11364/g.23962 Transcript_11364/m.23962 type:complete len:121 (+) Transcript_11364:237-599(+)